MPTPHRTLSFPAIWNMSFGFFGIQFGFGLQMANMSAIYQYLGASESTLPILWLAAPMTGLLVQPLIGYYSDRTWTRLGRRRPYFLTGAILASAALLALPNSSSLWMAAGLLWVLDASVNISMEPFRAFVGDLLPPEQRQMGFSMQSLLIGLGAVLSSGLPLLLAHLGVASQPGEGIPRTVHLAFYIGAAVFLASVVYTVVTTGEHPPTEAQQRESHSECTLSAIFRGLLEMPRAMRRLAVVQFFTWLGLFCMWLYFTPTIAHTIFGGTPGSPAYERGVEWGGACFSVYNGVAAVAAFFLVAMSNRGFSTRGLHRFGLVCAGLGLLTVMVWHHPWQLMISMVGVGIGWATILSMPYALLANAIPPERMGFYMGVFNFFIVIPQIVASLGLGLVVHWVLKDSSLPVIAGGGVCMLIAAVALSWVDDVTAHTAGAETPAKA